MDTPNPDYSEKDLRDAFEEAHSQLQVSFREVLSGPQRAEALAYFRNCLLHDRRARGYANPLYQGAFDMFKAGYAAAGRGLH